MYLYVPIFCLLPIAILFVPAPRDLYAHLRNLADRIPEHQLEPLLQFCRSFGIAEAECEFWEQSGGILGAFKRLTYSLFFLLIARALWRRGIIDGSNALYLMGRLALQAWYATKTIPEALYCCLLPSRPHFAARMSVLYYSDIATRTCILTSEAGGELSMLDLEHLI